jgi:hypothetical protein
MIDLSINDAAHIYRLKNFDREALGDATYFQIKLAYGRSWNLTGKTFAQFIDRNNIRLYEPEADVETRRLPAGDYNAPNLNHNGARQTAGAHPTD